MISFGKKFPARSARLLAVIACAPAAHALQSAQAPAGTSLKDWLTVAATITAALIAAGFAARSAAAQRALEREKLATARRDAELATLKSTISDYRRSQVLPFLEALDKTMIASYAAAHFPLYFPDLGGYIPQLRAHADEALHEWLDATQLMSRRRMQLLLAVNKDRISTVITLLSQFVDGMQQLIETRNLRWYKRASSAQLWEIHRRYIEAGYHLMMEIRDAALIMPDNEPALSEQAKKDLAQQLTVPFEKASVVSVPYGSVKDYSWIAIWETQTSEEWRAFVERLTHASHEEFEQKLTELTHELYDGGKMLDVLLTRVQHEDLDVFCLAIKQPSKQRLEDFTLTQLPALREKYSILWSSHRAPIEITRGLNATAKPPAEEATAKEAPSAPAA